MIAPGTLVDISRIKYVYDRCTKTVLDGGRLKMSDDTFAVIVAVNQRWVSGIDLPDGTYREDAYVVSAHHIGWLRAYMTGEIE